MKKIIVLSAVILTIFGCKKFIPDNTANVKLVDNLFSDNYTPMVKYSSLSNNTPNDNKANSTLAAVGRVLFYDTRMSLNNNISCASCHLQEKAFADGRQFSEGFDGGHTTRNSIGLTNLINTSSLFWDGRTPSLEQLALEPVSHPVEMGFEKIDLLPKKLALTDYYPSMFEKAFGSSEITKENISKALAQFLRSMASYSAPIDNTPIPQSSWNTTVTTFNQSENNGLKLFTQSRCTSCHNGANFGGQQFQNIGLESSYEDPGQGNKGSSKEGFFKVPSLRNVELTGPYMHDGRFATLKEVIEHYGKSIQPHPNLAPILTNQSWGNPGDQTPVQFNFTPTEVNDLVAFLKTMTDRDITTATRFSDPFIRR